MAADHHLLSPHTSLVVWPYKNALNAIRDYALVYFRHLQPSPTSRLRLVADIYFVSDIR